MGKRIFRKKNANANVSNIKNESSLASNNPEDIPLLSKEYQSKKNHENNANASNQAEKSLPILKENQPKSNHAYMNNNAYASSTHLEMIQIQSKEFMPCDIIIPIGSSITWKHASTSRGDFHSVKSGDGLFESKLLKYNETYTHTFSSCGDFEYYDKTWTNMVGCVHVVPWNEYDNQKYHENKEEKLEMKMKIVDKYAQVKGNNNKEVLSSQVKHWDETLIQEKEEVEIVKQKYSHYRMKKTLPKKKKASVSSSWDVNGPWIVSTSSPRDEIVHDIGIKLDGFLPVHLDLPVGHVVRYTVDHFMESSLEIEYEGVKTQHLSLPPMMKSTTISNVLSTCAVMFKAPGVIEVRDTPTGLCSTLNIIAPSKNVKKKKKMMRQKCKAEMKELIYTLGEQVVEGQLQMEGQWIYDQLDQSPTVSNRNEDIPKQFLATRWTQIQMEYVKQCTVNQLESYWPSQKKNGNGNGKYSPQDLIALLYPQL